MVEELVKDPVVNVVLYRLWDDHTAGLAAHVYRTNGVIEAKKSFSVREGRTIGQPFRTPTAASLKAFVCGCAPWQVMPFTYIVIVYRGTSPPPEEFTTVSDGTNGSYVWWAVGKHFELTIQDRAMIEEGLLDGRDPVEVFSEYAWNLLNEKA